ncbi:hypothetical protein SGLAD_v1c02130 [Spiroplasma gladiatoris]|uniref:Uncharacterized protein n=1 Tax=Spiroplasma gladiatoris TaxID=2143 RepID=A0A4P7AGX9_9MOLU|nr:hypothetical protein [Spiroplasma gladiatoris]QBQ07412.1 hypothetical protein SGLAD_v1c02130 [Spiroplasma gladiatoris]
MKHKGWEYYSHIPRDIISNEVYMLLSLFGSENKYLKLLEKRWFEKKDTTDFREYMEIAFEQTEVSEKKEVDRDSLSCLLRLMAICDTFSDYEYIYDMSKKIYDDPKIQDKDLRLYDYSFIELVVTIYDALVNEFNDLTVIAKYKPITKEIIDEVVKLSSFINDSKKVIQKTYLINDLISDLLDLLEDDSENKYEFEHSEEVILYNFAIYYSTKFYFALLLREKIIAEEEKITRTIIEENKPLIEEDGMRMSETVMLNEEAKEIFYKTLKN